MNFCASNRIICTLYFFFKTVSRCIFILYKALQYGIAVLRLNYSAQKKSSFPRQFLSASAFLFSDFTNSTSSISLWPYLSLTSCKTMTKCFSLVCSAQVRISDRIDYLPSSWEMNFLNFFSTTLICYAMSPWQTHPQKPRPHFSVRILLLF